MNPYLECSPVQHVPGQACAGRQSGVTNGAQPKCLTSANFPKTPAHASGLLESLGRPWKGPRQMRDLTHQLDSHPSKPFLGVRREGATGQGYQAARILVPEVRWELPVTPTTFWEPEGKFYYISVNHAGRRLLRHSQYQQDTCSVHPGQWTWDTHLCSDGPRTWS